MIPLSAPNIGGNSWKYIKECLDTEWVSSAGKYVDKFEEKIAQYTNSKYVVACVNGTSALQVSLQLAGVRPGDEVIVPTLTFIAPVNAINYNQATPVFMDVDEFYNLDIKKTINFIKNKTFFKNGKTYNKKTKKRISCLMPIHMWGNAVWLDDLVDICKGKNISIVEDSSESLGTFYLDGKYKNKYTGTIGELGCLSFNGNKIMTTGGGGAILTNNKKLYLKAKYLVTQAKDDPVRYIHHEIGYNFRLTNIQAALGVAQLEQLESFLERKKNIFKKYNFEISEIEGLSIAKVPDYSNNNLWMILLQIDKEIYGEDKEELMSRLNKKNIQTRPAWSPIHLQKPYQNCQKYKIKFANRLVENSLCLPSSTNISNKELNYIIEQLKKEK
tara:strand:- start:440 stop:1597 length:1158 start_codon:yes stop_codon:yes gene_type:complete